MNERPIYERNDSLKSKRYNRNNICVLCVVNNLPNLYSI